MKILRAFLITVMVLGFQNVLAQYSKSHYIPPITTTGNGAANPLDQYLYVSTPNEIPFNVTITPIGGTSTTFSISNSSPYEYSIGNNANTNLIALTANAVDKFTDKGFIVEAEDLVYVSARMFSGGYYQAGSLVSKGLAGLGKTFRIGTFENEGNLGNSQSNYINFVSVLSTTSTH